MLTGSECGVSHAADGGAAGIAAAAAVRVKVKVVIVGKVIAASWVTTVLLHFGRRVAESEGGGSDPAVLC